MKSITYDIFLSYCREDKEGVFRFKDLLESAGIESVWIDRDGINAGDRWRKVIAIAIENSKVVILCATAKSIQSEYVTKELLHAKRAGVPVLLIRFEENVDFSLSPELNFEFGNDDYKSWSPVSEEIDFSIYRSLKESFGVSSSVYSSFEALQKRKNRRTVRQIDFLPDIIDRIGQCNAYERFVAVGNGTVQNRPTVVLIHGEDQQLVPEFRKALVDYRLKAVFREENFSLELPGKTSPIFIPLSELQEANPDKLTFSLVQQFGLSRAASVGNLASYFLQNPGICHLVGFHVHLANKDAVKFKKFFRMFVNYWNEFPQIGEASVIVKLAISTDSRSKSGSWWKGRGGLNPLLEKLAHVQHSNCNFWCSLPALEDVPEEDAVVWVEQSEVENLLDVLQLDAGEVQSLIRRIYQSEGKSQLPMKKLAPALRDHLINHLHRRF